MPATAASAVGQCSTDGRFSLIEVASYDQRVGLTGMKREVSTADVDCYESCCWKCGCNLLDVVGDVPQPLTVRRPMVIAQQQLIAGIRS